MNFSKIVSIIKTFNDYKFRNRLIRRASEYKQDQNFMQVEGSQHIKVDSITITNAKIPDWMAVTIAPDQSVIKPRPSWEEYALKLAETAALRSEDPYIKVGSCVLRHDNSVGGIGYNGAPSSVNIDWTDRDERRKRVIHGEQNALRYVKPGECYLIASTMLPCNNCLTLIASYGIKKIVYRDEYDKDNSTLELAKEFGIELIRLK